MTREKMKKLLPIIQAWVDGKIIQVWTNDTWVDEEYPCFFEELSQFRIKPESKYRPFKTQKECWKEMLKHQPLGWLRSKRIKDIYQLITIRNHEIRIFADLPLRFSRAYREYEFLDGTPFGIKEE